jgi:hypothetical protein
MSTPPPGEKGANCIQCAHGLNNGARSIEQQRGWTAAIGSSVGVQPVCICSSEIPCSRADGQPLSLTDALYWSWRLTIAESKYWFCHTRRHAGWSLVCPVSASPCGLRSPRPSSMPNYRAGDEPEKSFFLIGASTCRALHSAGMRANTSLDHIKHLQAKCLHPKQVVCSREQRSSDVATIEYRALVTKLNDGQVLDRRWWFKEAYQVAIIS